MGKERYFCLKIFDFYFIVIFVLKLIIFNLKKKNMLIKRKIFCILIIGYVGCMYIEVWVV